MRLVVVSHTPHQRAVDGDELHGWGATVRELDAIAQEVDELVHVAPLHPGAPSSAMRAYRAPNVRVVTVEPREGDRLLDRLRAVAAIPGWVLAIRRELVDADAVHVRFPAAISTAALLSLAVRRRPAVRWFKYAGAWDQRAGVPRTYALQRFALRSLPWLHRGTVVIAGSAQVEPPHVRSVLNPALDADDLARTPSLPDRRLSSPVRLLFVGRLEVAKGLPIAIETAQQLRRAGRDVELHLVGDGPLRASVERREDFDHVVAHGWLDRAHLNEVYAASHVLLLPSAAEGFAKVIPEAMAFGCVPVVSDVGATRVVLDELGAGVVVADRSAHAFAEAVRELITTEGRWCEESARAWRASRAFSYEDYRTVVRDLLRAAPRTTAE